jgi:hypothetical protein
MIDQNDRCIQLSVEQTRRVQKLAQRMNLSDEQQVVALALDKLEQSVSLVSAAPVAEGAGTESGEGLSPRELLARRSELLRWCADDYSYIKND